MRTSHLPAALDSLALASLALASVVGCAPAAPLGPPVAPTAFCPRLARVVCDAHDDCCESTAALDDCEDVEAVACEETIGALVLDPRLRYVPEQAGAYLARLTEQGRACWAAGPHASELRFVFEGTGALGVSCTPTVRDEAPSARELFVAAASCGEDACRLHLDVAGDLEGVCEPRRVAGEDACSHPFDCPSGTHCDVSSDWRPGDWGRCRPLQTEGWACETDAACESGLCEDGVCARRESLALCLVVAYEDLVLAEGPRAYLRLGERSGRTAADASGHESHGTYTEPVAREAGAVTDDDDVALGLAGAGGHVSIPALEQLSPDALTIELFVSVPDMGGGPILVATGADDELVRLRADGRTLRASVRGTGDESALELASADGALTEGFHHVALVVSDGAVSLYLDGARIARDESSHTMPTAARIQVGFEEAEDPMMSVSLTGALDELAIYARALDESVLAAHVAAARAGTSRRDSFVYAWAR